MSKAKAISVAEYLDQQINMSTKSQSQIAIECGYEKPNVITMLKQGKTKVPVNKVNVLAKSLGIDPMHLFRLVLMEYAPETWAVVEQLVGFCVTENERMILEIIRKAAGNYNVTPTTPEDKTELAELVKKWRTAAGPTKRGAPKPS